MTAKDDIVAFLRAMDTDDASLECGDQVCCPSHGNCGICRFEYMKKEGWLKEGV